MEFDSFYNRDGDRFSYYMLPKLLVTDERFKSLSSDAKILYSCLLERTSLSFGNKWLNEENRVYIIFTVEEVMETLGRSNKTAFKILNELDSTSGTGTLISKLYDHGYKIYGQDFSKRMIEIAQNKMPNAKLFYGDISKGLVNPLLEHKYNAIIATYSLHHLTDEKKVIFLKKLLEQLYDGGCVYIGDMAFLSRSLHDKCMKEAYEQWDNDEIYFVVDEFRSYFPKLKFEKFSECSGLITLKK